MSFGSTALENEHHMHDTMGNTENVWMASGHCSGGKHNLEENFCPSQVRAINLLLL